MKKNENELKKEIKEMVDKCRDIKWLRVIHTYIKHLIG